MNPASIEKNDRGFAVRGKMTLATVRRLLADSGEIDFRKDGVLEVDLGQVEAADSAGLALLVEWLGKARRCNAEIRFLNLPGQMCEIARMTELDSVLPGCE
ncbi:MAG: STAS domain-containing protein, partial [Gammaproteobacteria bacterium]